MTEQSEQGIIDTLQSMFQGLTEVKVVTILGQTPVTITKHENRTTTDFTAPAGDADAFITIFNLVDGDATNVVSPAVLENQTLREFHSAQVEKSLATLPANISALVDLGKAILDELRGDGGE